MDSFHLTSMASARRSGSRSSVESSPIPLATAGMSTRERRIALSISSGIGAQWLGPHDLVVAVLEGVRLEGEDCDKADDLGALLVVVRRARPTQRPKPVLSRGGLSTCM